MCDCVAASRTSSRNGLRQRCAAAALRCCGHNAGAQTRNELGKSHRMPALNKETRLNNRLEYKDRMLQHESYRRRGLASCSAASHK